MRGASKIVAVATLALAGTALTACGGDDARAGGDGRTSVVVGFYPLQFAAERVGGDAVTVTSLAAPGAEPHDLELTPQQVAAVADADLTVYFKGFQPSLDEAVAQQAADRSLDVAAGQALLDEPEGHEEEAGGEEALGGKDPHLWLDPTRLAALGDAVAAKLSAVDTAGAEGYRTRAAALRQELTTLDTEFRQGLSTCARKEIVVSHAAFGYLTDRYGLRQIPITGLTPEDEPGPQRLAEVARQARRYGVTTIFFETLVSPAVADALAREVGAKAEVLDPIEGLAAGTGGDYLSVMRQNLTRLRAALGCA